MKNAMSRTIQALCLVPLITLGLSSAAQAQTKPAAPMTHADMPKGSPGPEPKAMAGAGDMKHSMTMGMENMQKMTMSGNVDKDFAMMMKIHHQGA